ncbi:hypothetical protein NTE_02943 [Candidatus Nitrososphaera evergladensis SR1]|jgi:hypothetical protein|uniref:Uncharacterized protein n=1 Tax=Candidatus Nitrososphaera evergladensis SR1 TaxID=1459636 RepID=A0A075N0G8_9ARCH|nr:hypothetical protein NTE_02943 [Candidatus Nitrososphaera evergladensis SR1]
MGCSKLLIRQYISYLADNARKYRTFNKQLVVGELAGIAAGLLVAELAIAIALDEAGVSIASSAADYLAALAGFLAIFYFDSRKEFMQFGRGKRVQKVCVMALRLWPSVAAADIVFIFVRPYVQYLLLGANIEAGVTSVIAHFVAFAAFNLTAIFSRSIMDFWQSTKKQRQQQPS